MSVAVRPDNNWAPGTPTKVMDGSYLRPAGLTIARTYDVARDGKRFLRIKPDAGPDAPITVVVVQNWTEELKQLVPSPK